MSYPQLILCAGFNEVGGPEYLVPLRNPITAIEISTSLDLWIDVSETTPMGRTVVTRYRFGGDAFFAQAIRLLQGAMAGQQGGA